MGMADKKPKQKSRAYSPRAGISVGSPTARDPWDDRIDTMRADPGQVVARVAKGNSERCAHRLQPCVSAWARHEGTGKLERGKL